MSALIAAALNSLRRPGTKKYSPCRSSASVATSASNSARQQRSTHAATRGSSAAAHHAMVLPMDMPSVITGSGAKRGSFDSERFRVLRRRERGTACDEFLLADVEAVPVRMAIQHDCLRSAGRNEERRNGLPVVQLERPALDDGAFARLAPQQAAGGRVMPLR